MSPEIYILTISLPFLTAIIVFAMKYASSYAAARARHTEQGEIKTLVEGHAAQLAQATTTLKAIEAELVRQSRALSSVEAILKQVG